MSGLITEGWLDCFWQGQLSDYVTAIAWSPTQASFAASSAAGEVQFWPSINQLRDRPASTTGHPLLTTQSGRSIDCLAFSPDGQFLAAGGQAGWVKIWHLQTQQPELIATLNHAPAWVDHLAWNPTQNQLAFSLGKSVQVWDATQRCIIANLNFDRSSVLNLTWHPAGDRLTVSGYQGVKIWTAQDWQDDPYLLTIPSATVAIAWSPDGKYIAAGNLDRTITVLEWGNPHPWVMRGFSGKIRQLAWSDVSAPMKAPLLASASAESIVIWQKHPDDAIGWAGRGLGNHDGIVQSIAFQPQSLSLASAADDGWVGVWDQAEQIAQTLNGASAGFTCLAWHPQADYLAAGGRQGELLIWSA